MNAPETLPVPLPGRDADPLGTAGRFAPVRLPELLDRAGLQRRYDRKYAVDPALLPGLLTMLDPSLRVLEIDGQRGFRYDSLYFDTPAYDGYLLTAYRRRRRFKVRTRRYTDSGGCFLEVKTRDGRGQTVKHRTGIAPGRLELLDRRGLDFVESVLRETGAPPGTARRLRPVLWTRYRRTTLLLADGCSRATVDLLPEWVDPDGSRRIGHGRMAIVETKTAGGASELDRLLWRRGVRPQRISKYATGLALLHPELPSNRWHRILHASFPASRSPAPPERG